MLTSSPEAVAIYETYPRKVGKPVAIKKILKAITAYGFSTVLEKTKAYAERVRQVGRPIEFIPYPATFFHQERFNDDLDALVPLLPQSSPTIKPPAWQRVKTLQALLEENKKALHECQLPNPLRYVEPNGELFNRHLAAAKAKRESLKSTRATLEQKLAEAQKEVCGA